MTIFGNGKQNCTKKDLRRQSVQDVEKEKQLTERKNVLFA